MKKFYTVLFAGLLFTGAGGQNFSIGELVNFTAYPSNKFDAVISRKGFKPYSFEGDAPAYYKASSDKTLETIIARQNANDAASVTYQTTSLTEFNQLQEDLKKIGFIYAEGENNKSMLVQLYQKGNVTVQPLIKEEDEKKIYCFLIERKALPKAKDIIYAEDLLQLSSHEYLAAVFGEANIKRDFFYFSDHEINKCSVLFPNTNRQVIFIWDDEVNNRKISFLLIGDHLRTQNTLTYHKQIEQNSWQSSQGIYSGMSLKELVNVNGQHIYFYGWESEQPGLVVKKNTGTIDFKKVGIVLNCLDCSENKRYIRNNVINSADILSENRRVYVSTIIVLPAQ